MLALTSLPIASLAAERTGIALPRPLTDTDFLHDGRPPEALVDLGRDLFFDPILSGNRNISCGTCHDPSFGTSDGLALGIGEGGDGAGPQRRTAEPVTGRVPRNAPALWNVGARAQRAMFHDGRLEAFEGERLHFRIPSGAPLPEGLDSLLAAQAFFPVTSSIEMAGQRGENEVADALVTAGFTAAWDVIARRVASVEGYAEKFPKSFQEIGTPDQIAYRHIAEALAAFQTSAFRSDTSPFDKALRGGDPGHLSQEAQAGAAIFYGKARCASCHSGPLLTDQDFHAIAVPQIGPGKGHGGADGYWKATGLMAFLEDEGRYRVTGDAADLFAFRTPSLRNVAVTGPWGHSGAFDSLERMVRHHLDAISSLASYRPEETTLPPLDAVMDQLGEDTPTGYSALDHETQAAFENRDGWVQASPSLRGRIAAASTLEPVSLTDAEVGQILSFLETLTDPAAIKRAAQIPDEVPSGLPPQPTPKPAN
ncbi:MAG: cytochrome c peroxidase [Pseudomonadota bacterium]